MILNLRYVFLSLRNVFMNENADLTMLILPREMNLLTCSWDSPCNVIHGSVIVDFENTIVKYFELLMFKLV